MSQRIWQHAFRPIAGITMSLAVSACGLSDLLNGDDPPEGGVVHPDAVTTYEGAVGVYHSVIHVMTEAMSQVSLDVGVMTDELSGGGPSKVYLDARTKSSDADEGLATDAYGTLQTVRIRAAQASELLLRYGNDASRPMIGHAYALQAQAILTLAELHCSGVPLTEVPFENDLQFSPGLPTSTLFERAIALFDTALTYGKDSIPVATLARVGKGRALLNLGKYAEAAEAVAEVTSSDKYTVTFTTVTGGVVFWQRPTEFSILNQEGGNGVQWHARPAPQDVRVPLSGTTTIRQQKYTTQAVTLTMADGIQARMIEAEAQLQPASAPGGPWLETLNAARATRTLAPLTDPGTADERINLLFKERAFWFYLNGQRLGDLRRLVRNYGRLPVQVYAAGVYPFNNPRLIAYGTEYVFALPRTERQYNPLYEGCIDKRP